MAKSFSSTEDATDAIFLYLQNKKSVHDITSKYGVNTYRLYEAVDGETWQGAYEAALNKLKVDDPEAFDALPSFGKVRRTNFGFGPSDQFNLFG